MKFLYKIFNFKNEKEIVDYADFWDWFITHEQKFYQVIKEKINIEKQFLNKIEPKLKQINEGYFYLAGMLDENTAELIITADGSLKNMVYVEEIINAAPKIDRWKFTAHKPASNDDITIAMDGFEFNSDKLRFYTVENDKYPDEISLVFTHDDFEKDEKTITNGTYIYLDNYIGEIKNVTQIDRIKIISPKDAEKELISVEKLDSFLVWREKEFIEKYEGERIDTENDNYGSLELTNQSGLPSIIIMNLDLLKWSRKASHPWMVILQFKYDGSENNGLPEKNTYNLMNEIEEEILNDLKDIDGYLNIGRDTGDNLREVFFACKDFRKPSKILNQVVNKYKDSIDIDFEIYKDKYWKILEYCNVN